MWLPALQLGSGVRCHEFRSEHAAVRGAPAPVAARVAGGAAGPARPAGDRAAQGCAAPCRDAPGPGARALPHHRGRTLLALRDRRDGAALRRPRAAARRRLDRAPRRRGHRGAARRVRLDARAGRGGKPVAALHQVPAHAGRLAELGRGPHGADAVRAHCGATGAPDARSEYVLLLPRPPGGQPAVPARGRHELGHQHRPRHRMGVAPDRERTRSCAASRRTRSSSCCSRTDRRSAASSRTR